MKRLALIIATIIMAVTCTTAQNNATNNNEPAPPVYKLDKKASFPGGIPALIEFLSNNLQYPENAMNEGVEGKVICQFTVSHLGYLDDIKVVRSVHPSLDEEAVRVILSMPVWAPGEMDGMKVDSRYTLPISFKLPEEMKKKK